MSASLSRSGLKRKRDILGMKEESFRTTRVQYQESFQKEHEFQQYNSMLEGNWKQRLQQVQRQMTLFFAAQKKEKTTLNHNLAEQMRRIVSTKRLLLSIMEAKDQKVAGVVTQGKVSLFLVRASLKSRLFLEDINRRDASYRREALDLSITLQRLIKDYEMLRAKIPEISQSYGTAINEANAKMESAQANLKLVAFTGALHRVMFRKERSHLEARMREQESDIRILRAEIEAGGNEGDGEKGRAKRARVEEPEEIDVMN